MDDYLKTNDQMDSQDQVQGMSYEDNQKYWTYSTSLSALAEKLKTWHSFMNPLYGHVN